MVTNQLDCLTPYFGRVHAVLHLLQNLYHRERSFSAKHFGQKFIRENPMNMKKISLMMVVLIGSAVNASAQAGQTANHYSCSSPKIQLTLSTGMDAEVSIYPVNTELSLTIGKKIHTYSTPDITTLSTVMGHLYQVELPAQEGSKVTKHASVIIPTVNVNTAITGNARPGPTKFKTKLILTREPIKADEAAVGVINPSLYTDISCRAEVLYW